MWNGSDKTAWCWYRFGPRPSSFVKIVYKKQMKTQTMYNDTTAPPTDHRRPTTHLHVSQLVRTTLRRERRHQDQHEHRYRPLHRLRIVEQRHVSLPCHACVTPAPPSLQPYSPTPRSATTPSPTSPAAHAPSSPPHHSDARRHTTQVCARGQSSPATTPRQVTRRTRQHQIHPRVAPTTNQRNDVINVIPTETQ